MKKEIEKLLKLCIVRESNYPWASPIVAICKKTGELRLCVDFRKLNEITEKDAFPLLRCDDLLDVAGQGNPRFITKLDMAQGFHHVPLSKDASKKTAFIMPEGHYQYVTMPIWFDCAPAVFQHLMTKILKGLLPQYVFFYIDDMLIITLTFELHLEILQKVLNQLQLYDMLVKASKCDSLADRMVYLGFELSAEGNSRSVQKSRCGRHQKLVMPEQYARVLLLL